MIRGKKGKDKNIKKEKRKVAVYALKEFPKIYIKTVTIGSLFNFFFFLG